jgi:hypothetical protein
VDIAPLDNTLVKFTPSQLHHDIDSDILWRAFRALIAKVLHEPKQPSSQRAIFFWIMISGMEKPSADAEMQLRGKCRVVGLEMSQ